ncbi:hypothetical protein KOR42_23280 [Thalassoglobus neptunius]|uniref:Uncharacterized protein n=1 Tax=Thalassoglobus neptunius TaxID=1938619 RepID=A0A5C5X981_9PLAN|nr:hypothetical protein [Thalassoglobus neptunius]TWT58941.1 hypothetical protein KOR42_23280 [Thalassoglobus neptunius]
MSEQHVVDRYANAVKVREKCRNEVEVLRKKLMQFKKVFDSGWRELSFPNDHTMALTEFTIPPDGIPTVDQFREKIEAWQASDRECKAALQSMTNEQKNVIKIADEDAR